MNSTIKVKAKFSEELNQSNENSDTHKEGIQHIKAKLGVVLKNGKTEQCMASILEVWTDSLLTEKTIFCCCRGEI
jgi:hypothetical protein